MEIDRPYRDSKFNTKRKGKKPMEQRPDDSPKIDVDECYEVRRKPVALILNNNKFPVMRERTGSNKDVDNLEVLLEGLGFDVKTVQDLTASDMKKFLLEASNWDYEGTNYFFCALCSHGEDGVIFGTDGDPELYVIDPHHDDASWLELRDIFNMFSGESCKSLVGKPKLFVIQACRGETLQEPVVHTDFLGDVAVAEVGVKPTIPSEADFVIAYATSEGNSAIRSPLAGSWYIQDFTKVFKEYGTQREYQHLLTVVNKLVSEREVPEDTAKSTDWKGRKQMPCFLSKFTKQLFLT